MQIVTLPQEHLGNGETTLLGMNSTAWIWLVIGIATIAIIALVWYYGKQNVNNHNRRLD